MPAKVETAIIAVLAVVTVICIVAVFFLVRWLKKVTANDGDDDSFSDGSDEVDVSIFAPSEFAGSPTNAHDDLEAWAADTRKASGVMGFGMDVGEQTYYNNMVLPGQGGHDPNRFPPGNHMFELGVTSTDGFGRRETKTLYIPHVNNLGELGLVVSGDAPVVVYKVDPGSAAARAGVDTGDELISIGGTKCAQSRHQQVVDLFTNVITTAQTQQQQHLGGSSGFGGGGGGGSSNHAPQQAQRWSADQGTMGFGGGDFGGGGGGSSNPATVEDIAISLPGQAGDMGGGGGGGYGQQQQQQQQRDGPEDPYAPIREAAARHQVEAARLMQEERFKEARVLLDRAIGLLQSIPQESESPVRKRPSEHNGGGGGDGGGGGGGSRRGGAVKGGGTGSKSKYISSTPGFRVPARSNAPRQLALSTKPWPVAKGKRRKPATKAVVAVIRTLDQLPEKVGGRDCGFKPIKRYHVAQRKKAAKAVTVTASPTRMAKPARQQAW